MRGIFSELKKVMMNRLFVVMTVLLLGVNFFCLFSTCKGRGTTYAPKQYRELWELLLKLSPEQRREYLEKGKEEVREAYASFWSGDGFDASLWEIYSERNALLSAVQEELTAANGFEAYRKSVEQKKNTITSSVLFRDESTFASKSAKKTFEEYQGVKSPKIVEAPSKGVELAALTATDLFAAFAGIFACIVLFVREREQDMVRLQWTLRRGRVVHLAYKLAALFLCSLGLAVAFYGSNYIFAQRAYGFGTPFRDIRMVRPYATSLKGCPVLLWLCINFFFKVIVLFVVLLVCSFFCTRLKRFVSIVLGFSGVLLIEYFLYIKIPANSVFAPFRYVNLVALFQVDEWYLKYSHINIFGTPVNYGVCAVALLILTAVLGFLGSFFGYLGYGRKLEHRSGVKKERKLEKRDKSGYRVFGWELWKGLVMQRLLPVMAGLLFLQGGIYYKTKVPPVTTEEYFYRIYMNRLEGEITEETPAKLEEIYAELSKQNNNSMQLSAYQRVVERYEYLKEHGGALFYDTGVQVLIGEKEPSHDAALSVKVMAVVLLLAAAVFSYDPEHRMQGLLHSTVYGEKKSVRKKLLLAGIFCVCACAGVYIPDILLVARQYGIKGLQYPAVSLPALVRFGDKLSVGGYLLLLYAVRVLACICITPFILLAAEKWKSFVYTFLGCAVVLLCLPLLTVRKPQWTLLSYPLYGVYGNVLLQGSSRAVLVYVILFGMALLWALWERRRLWR